MDWIEGMKKRWGVLFWPIPFEKSMRNPMDMVGKIVEHIWNSEPKIQLKTKIRSNFILLV